MKCSKHRKDGEPCEGQAVAGTDACSRHAGRPLAEQKARGAVALEVSAWRVGDETMDPRVVLLRLMTQSYRRADLYGSLLEEAYEAAELLRQHHEAGALLTVDEDTLGGGGGDEDFQEPPSVQAARDTLDRVFTTGGVAALIGSTYSTSQAGHLYATGEAIRGLVQLEGQERDRAAAMAAKAAAAKLGERQIELAEQHVQDIVGFMRAVLADVGALLASGVIASVDPSAPEVVRVVSSRLRALPGSGVAA